MRVDDTLAAISAMVDRCAGCGRDLGASPSGYFCSQDCQARWMRARTTNPEQILGPDESRRSPGGSDRTAAAPCPHCSRFVRRFPTVHGRVQVVNAQTDPDRGNIRWLPGEGVCVQYGAEQAARIRAEPFGDQLYVFHGLDCPETRARSSSTPRPRGERTAPPAEESTRARLREQVATQLGWRPEGSWKWRRRGR